MFKSLSRHTLESLCPLFEQNNIFVILFLKIITKMYVFVASCPDLLVLLNF
jgi:hypothetical protein